MIAAEMTGSAAGLGWVIHTAGHLNMAPEIYAAGVCVVLLGFTINRSLVRLSDRAFFWRPAAGTMFGVNREDSSRGPLSLTAVGLLVAAVILALIIGLYKMAQDGRLAAALS